MAQAKEEDMKITVICRNCDHKFSFLLSTIKRKRVVYLGDDDEALGSTLITPKTYMVACPKCGAETMKEMEVEGQAPSPENLFWRQAIQEIRKDSLKTVTDTAKQLIALVTLLSGLYFHAITFTNSPQGYTDVKVLFVGPLVLWMLCLLAATLVLFPFPYKASPYAPEEAQQLINRSLRWKYGFLVTALVILVISMGWLVVAAWYFLGFYTTS